jgi:hypothetical protein
LVAGAGCSGAKPEWYVDREVKANELEGSWQPPADRHLRDYVTSILQVPLEGRQLLLYPAGLCGLSPPLQRAPVIDGPVFPRHADGCHWQVAMRANREGERPVAVVDLVLTWEGRQRGVTFFVRQRQKALELWTPLQKPDDRRALFVRASEARKGAGI